VSEIELKHSSQARKWGVALLLCLWLEAEHSSAQFVEVACHLETTWLESSSGKPTQHRSTNDVQCIFGTNLWLIAGDFSANAKYTWYCTDSNLVQHVLITKEFPGSRLHVGQQFKNVYNPADKRPLSRLEELTWLAFCSGSFLKAEGRRILPPFTLEAKKDEYSDKTQVFADALGLPERVEFYWHDHDLVSTYQVQQSTNFVGWMVPVRFEYDQNHYPASDPPAPYVRVSGVVSGIRQAPPPLVTPKVMKLRAQ
jgi:hypothetical protein